MARLLIRPEASADVEEAATWYEDRRPGLGYRFFSEVNRVFGRIEEGPLPFPRIEGDVRRALVRKFPYAAYFVDEQQNVVVLAVLHCRRHADHWRSRI